MNAKIAGIGFHVPERIVTNEELTKVMDTTSEWIVERTGIEERRYADKHKDTTSTLAAEAAKIAIERAGITAEDIDFIVFATLSPDYYFPGSGVLLQRHLGIKNIGCLDIRTQCTGFIYGISIADQYIKSGMYKNVLVVGAEVHSAGLDFSTRGRNVTVIFGDGAGAVVLQATEEDKGILTTNLHADGEFAEHLAFFNPGTHGDVFLGDKSDLTFEGEPEFGGMHLTQEMIDKNAIFPYMNGRYVFKHACEKFPAAIVEACEATGHTPDDINMLIPHQANLRISQMIQLGLGFEDERVYNNIQKYGNTTAASIPIALCEAWEKGLIKDGDLVCLAAFGSGFTWGAALLRW